MVEQSQGLITRPKYPKVIIDTREQYPWVFNNYESITDKLDTGDYSLIGYQDILSIERKGSVTEFAANLIQKRFEDELKRLAIIKYHYIICEFSYQDLANFPFTLKSHSLQKKIKLRGSFLLSRIIELQIQYPFYIYFIDKQPVTFVEKIFKKVIQYES